MRSTRHLCALALVLGIVGTAPAVTLTSPVLVGGTGDQLGCYVTNVGTKAINVVVTLHDEIGNLLSLSADTCTLLGGVLAAGQTCFIYRDPAPGYGRCAVEAGSSKIRAALSSLSAGHVRSSIALTK